MNKPLEWDALWAAMDAAPDVWQPTTESMYWQMLECVPPRAMDAGRFLVGEATRHGPDGKAIYACFRQQGDQYAATYMSLEQFRNAK